MQDTADAFLAIAQSNKAIGETINIGMNDEISVGDLAKRIAAITGKKAIITTDQQRIRVKKSEVERLRADNTMISTLIGWKPKYDLDKGLTETASWIKKNLNQYKSGIYNV